MNKIKQFALRLRRLYIKKPVLVIPSTIVMVFVLLAVAEYTRTWTYMRQVNDYQNSSRILQLKDSVDQLVRASQSGASTVYCSLVFDEEQSKKTNSVEPIIGRLQKQVELASPAPAFSSLLESLPRPREARQLSEEMRSALEKMDVLTRQDARSSYCNTINDELKSLSFLLTIQEPQGVSALLVGQLEEFQVNVKQTQDRLKTMQFPEMFEEEHIMILETLQTIAVDLRHDDNDYAQFAKKIEADVITINDTLDSLRSKTKDLQTIPQQIALLSSYL